MFHASIRSGLFRMRDILFPEPAPSDENPMRRAQKAMLKPLPKRFYQSVSVGFADGEGYRLLLDGKGARTPGGHPLALPTAAAAAIIAAEWDSQTTVIDPATMHATRMVHTARDAVARDPAPVRAEIARYAGSDLVCYRADAPEGLVEAQTRLWDPVLHHIERRLNVRFAVSTGIVYAEQPPTATAAVAEALEKFQHPVALSCAHVLTTLSGSVLLALMVAEKAISIPDAYAAAEVDEAWNREQWGTDEDAMAARARRVAEFTAAAELLLAL